MCVYIYTHIYMCVYIYTHIYIYTHTHIYGNFINGGKETLKKHYAKISSGIVIWKRD